MFAPRTSALLVHPSFGGRRPGYQLLVLEPQSDLLVGRFDRIRAVDDVTSDLDAQIATDGAGLGVGRVGGAQHLAAGLDGVQALPDHRHDRAGAHVRDQSGEERTGRQVGVVLLEQLLRWLKREREREERGTIDRFSISYRGQRARFFFHFKQTTATHFSRLCGYVEPDRSDQARGCFGSFAAALFTYPHELHRDQLEALGLEALHDLADQSTLDSVGLDHDEGTFLVGGHRG